MLREKSDDFSVLTSTKYIEQQEYWINKLSGDYPGTEISLAGKRSPKTGKALESIEIVIPGKLSAQLMHLSYRNMLTIYVILLAGLKALIYRYTGNETVTVISPLYRPRKPEKIMNECLFIQDVMQGGMSFKELLLEVKQSVLAAYENQDYPSEKLIEYLVNNSLIKTGCISNIVCLLKNIHDDTRAKNINPTLVFSLDCQEDLVKGHLLYDPGIYPGYFAEQVSSHYITQLEILTGDVNVKISDICFLSKEEKSRLLFTFNNNKADFSKDKSIAQLIEKYAQIKPDGTAVVFREHAITFGELNERANRLANFLRKTGLQKDQAVGILLNRSLMMVLGILSTWKAGGAYIPIDPTDPLERIKYIVENSQASILLTDTEVVKKYSFTDLQDLQSIRLEPYLTHSRPDITDLDRLPIPDAFPAQEPSENALRVLLLDLSQLFSIDSVNMPYNVVEVPLGLMDIMTYLKRQLGDKINGKIAKSRIDFDDYPELKQLFDEFRPDVIGVRTLTPFKDFYHKTISLIKQWEPDIPVIAGGPYATSDYASQLQDSNIDVVVLGEGELTFCELIVKFMENGGKLPGEEVLKEIAGLAFIPGRTNRKKKKKLSPAVVLLDESEKVKYDQPGGNPKTVNQMSDLAYIIYTSGSTGKPKGAMIEHIGMMNHIQAKINDLHLTSASIVAQNASHTFDISVWQFFAALAVGGKIIIYPIDSILEPTTFLTQLNQHRMTILEVVPSYLSVMLDLISREPHHVPPTLKYLLVTGEEVKPSLVKRWFELYPHIKMVNAYGPTEASDDITHYIMEKAADLERIPLGKPVQNLNIYIVDNDMNLCPVGVVGEICVSGVGVGRGYLNDQERTKKVFMEDPFPGVRGIRLYKTGDSGYWLPDGTIEFHGRKDYQVKIRGFRIELGEIENCLIKHEGVKEAAVIDKEDEKKNKNLLAFLVMSTPGSCNIREIKKYLETELPAYMVPTQFIELEEMPLTPNGKVDRQALQRHHPDTRSFIPYIPHHLVEDREYKNKLTGDFLQETLEDPAVVSQKETAALREYSTRKRKDYYPLCHSQKMVYYIEKTYPGTGCENDGDIVLYPGIVEKKLLQQAINNALYKNENLRTRIAEVEHGDFIGPAQYIFPHQDYSFESFAFTGIDGRQQLEKWVLENNDKPFEFIDGDLFYFALITLNEEETGYYMKLHHIISDGGSTALLIHEIDSIYQELRSGKAWQPQPLPSHIQYMWDEKTYLNALQAKKDRESWLNDLLPLPEEVVISPKRYNSPGLQGSSSKLVFPDELRSRMHEYRKSHNISLYKLILSALSIYVSRVTWQDEFIIGTVNHGRYTAVHQQTKGMLINFIPLKIILDDHMVFSDFVEKIGQEVNRILKNHARYPGDLLASDIKTITGKDTRYFWNITLIGHPDQERKEFCMEHISSHEEATPLTIHINCSNKDIHGILELEWVYQLDWYTPTDIVRVHQRLVRILTKALQYPGKKLIELDVLSEEEKKQVLLELNESQGVPSSPLKSIIRKIFNYPRRRSIAPIVPRIEIAGNTLDPGEIEDLLQAYEPVETAVVIGKEKKPGNKDKYLCAFVVSRRHLGESELKEYLSRQLPLYKVPAVFFRLEKMPVATNGAPDRKRLMELDLDFGDFGTVSRDEGYEAPMGPVEEKLAEIWSTVLGIDRQTISRGANFFDLGGHSLKSIMLVSIIHRDLQVKLPLEAVFNQPRLLQLAQYIKGRKKDGYESIAPAEHKTYYALSSAQQRLFVLSRMNKGSTGYNIPAIFTLEGHLDKEKVQGTIRKLINRHESLRTSFELIENIPVQRIHAQVDFEIESYNLATEDTENTEGTRGPATRNSQPASALISSFIRPFDLSRAPMLRVGLMELPHTPAALRVHPSQEGREQKYVLMVDVHHIISDGISMDIFIREFKELYCGKPLPPLRLQYKDFSIWQNSRKHREKTKYQEEYWVKQLEGGVPVLSLPTDYARPSIQGFEGSKLSFGITAGQTRDLKEMARKEEVTLFMVLLTLFNIFLSKVSNQEDIVVGSPISGRRHSHLGNMMGMFVNTLVLRNFPGGEKPFLHFLREVKESTLEAFENQDYQFEDLVEKVSIERDTSRNPLFDVMFVLQDIDMPEVEIPGLKVSPYPYEDRTSKFDLTLWAKETGDHLRLGFDYYTKIFKKETIERFITFFKIMLRSILEETGKKISRVEIIPEEEKNRVLFDFNNTTADYPAGKVLHELLRDQVEKSPDHTTVLGSILQMTEDKLQTMPLSKRNAGAISPMAKYKNAFITYMELNRNSNQLAHQLREKGIPPHTIVGIMVERSIEMIIALMGILKAGGAYLPIDPDYPQERINYMLADSQANVLVTTPNLSNEITYKNGIVYVTDAINPLRGRTAIVPRPSHLHLSPAPVTSLAYVIYTSGTTGRPKGVMVEHHSVVNTLMSRKENYKINQNHTFLQLFSYAFDGFVTSFFTPAISGAKVVLLEEKEVKDITKIKEAIVKHHVTHFISIPVLFQAILENLTKEESRLLQVATLAGDKVSAYIVEMTRQKNEDIEIANEYGVTEGAVMSTIHRHQERSGEISIGKPVWNTRIYILGKDNQLQPPGVWGELCLAGVGVARGYLNNPERTAEKFDHDLWDYQDGQDKRKKTPKKTPGKKIQKIHRAYRSYMAYISKKIYKTGDLARWMSDGNIEFLGRMDRQVKIRGFRIELGEIENQLVKDENIKAAVVLVKRNQAEGKYLGAFIVPAGPGPLDLPGLKRRLSEQLPNYMIPANFVILENLPLTPAGKVDQQALAALADAEWRKKKQGEYVPPGDTLEKLLVEAWEKVLGQRPVGVNDNFFQVGGDSIKIIQVISYLNKQGYKLKMTDIFRNPRISDLAPLVKKIERIPIQEPVSGILPLTPIQKWFFENRVVDRHHFNQAVMLYAAEGFAEVGLRAVFSKLPEHHDALRMTFKEEHGEVIQINHGLEYPSSLEVYDFRGCKDALAMLEAEANQIHASIDMENGPLMKVGLFHLDDGDRLLVTVHHLVIDGVSWRILLEDFLRLYRQYKKQKHFSLPLKSDSLKIWAEQLAAYANSKEFLKEKTYWQELDSKAFPVLRKDFEEEKNLWRDTRTTLFRLTREQTHHLLTRANEAFGTEINDLLVTALGLATRKIYGHETLVIAMESHGREGILAPMAAAMDMDIDISRTIGWFTCIYPVGLDFSPGWDLSRQIKEVKERLRQVPNKGVGYGMLKYLTAREHKEGISFTLKPQIIFNYLGQFDEEIRQSSFEIVNPPAGNPMSLNAQRNYELEVSGMVIDNRLQMSIGYNTGQYKTETIETLGKHFKIELERVISFCSNREERDLTPGDLTYPGLSIETLERLKGKYPLEDIYPCTPLQEGMIFHALYDQHSSAYFIQLSYRFHGQLDMAAVRKALQELVNHYEILRSVFVHEDLDRPLQLILKKGKIDVYYRDIREPVQRGGMDIDSWIKVFKKEDRQQFFDLRKDTLLRAAVLRVGEAEYEFIWSNHHILMDGWGGGILYSRFLEMYNNYIENRPYQFPADKPYRCYIRWLENQDKEKAREYWRCLLEDYKETASIPKRTAPGTASKEYKREEILFTLGPEKTSALDKMAVTHQVTLSLIFQTLWGILLARYNGKQDVVFGIVVSGRPPQVEGVESMIGLFINTIPVRIRFQPNTAFIQLVRQVQKQSLESEPYHYYSLAEIQAQSHLKRDLIDHFLTFSNYPIGDIVEDVINGKNDSREVFPFQVSNIETVDRSNYNFDVLVKFQDQMDILLRFNTNVYNRDFMKRMLVHIEEVMDQVMESNEIKIRDIVISHDRLLVDTAIPMDDNNDFEL
ncbi:MAG: amino acid adenylation domain-containing protein [Candidatus Aminicenantes bacterium]|nr:MAG: amino acid adenylation domain-containing protein [Candidatus Aminicenantes bacterium]